MKEEVDKYAENMWSDTERWSYNASLRPLRINSVKLVSKLCSFTLSAPQIRRARLNELSCNYLINATCPSLHYAGPSNVSINPDYKDRLFEFSCYGFFYKRFLSVNVVESGPFHHCPLVSCEI